MKELRGEDLDGYEALTFVVNAFESIRYGRAVVGGGKSMTRNVIAPSAKKGC